MVCQQRQEQAGLPRCTDVPCPISLSRATVSPVGGFCLRANWLAALHAWRAVGAARLGNSRSGKSETDVAYDLPLPAEVRWFSCFAAFRHPLDLAGGRQLPALAEGVKVES